MDTELMFKRPIKTKIDLYKQFQLDQNRRIENQLFLRENKVETMDNRVNLFEMDSVFNFFDYVQGPEFVSGA